MKYTSIFALACALIIAVSLTVRGYSGAEAHVRLEAGDFPSVRGYYYNEGDELRYDFALGSGETVEAEPRFVKQEYDWVNLRGIDSPNLYPAIKLTIPDDAEVTILEQFKSDGKSFGYRIVRADKISYQYVLTDKRHTLVPFVGREPFEGAIELGEPRELESKDGFEVIYCVKRDPFGTQTFLDTDIPCALRVNGKAIFAGYYDAWYSDGVLHYYDMLSGELRAAELSSDKLSSDKLSSENKSAVSDRLVARLGLSGEIQWLYEADGIYLLAMLDGDVIRLYKYDGELSKPYALKLSLGDYHKPRVSAVISNGAACFRVQTSYHIYSGGVTHYCALSLEDWSLLASGDCEVSSNTEMVAIYYDEWRDFDAYFDGKIMYALDNCSYSIYLNTTDGYDVTPENLKLIAKEGGGLLSRLVTFSAVGADGLLYSKQPLSSDFPIGSKTGYIVRLGFDVD